MNFITSKHLNLGLTLEYSMQTHPNSDNINYVIGLMSGLKPKCITKLNTFRDVYDVPCFAGAISKDTGLSLEDTETLVGGYEPFWEIVNIHHAYRRGQIAFKEAKRKIIDMFKRELSRSVPDSNAS